ncbi:GNAT family N-acetyltransferase [Fluviispira multicolorata]|uniref:GNAT family N-acetyltransferase n=1 Tax=Fluviispira multicolorata TaxID=2654512 RepID=A0A833JB48_9BACT|nr:GNAT family N-acetyltransferase [Fluviispira multicolorata]KAB8028620.1 GNAT family N-acetyltransferase [Fluviispira multicolorata]
MTYLLGIDKDIEAFVNGWAKSRCVNHVHLNYQNGFISAEFDKPIGTIQRKYEFFVWSFSDFNSWDFNELSNNEFHIVSLFNPTEAICKDMEDKGYINIVNESFMSLKLKNIFDNFNDSTIELIQNQEQVNWYNKQRGNDIINWSKINDKSILFFCAKIDDKLASWARLIINNNYAVIDDVQTKDIYRRQGLAKKIMNKLIFYSFNHEVSNMVLSASNEGKYLYESYGFKMIFELKVFAKCNSLMYCKRNNQTI